LGVTTEAIRGRIRRNTIRHERVGGRVYVLLPAEQSSDQIPDHTAELIATLREQLEQANERDRENRRIIAALTSRIPAIEAPSEPRESPESPGPTETPTEAAREAQEPRVASHGMHMPEAGGGPLPRDQQTASERPWWRRMFGG
jgi:hypothetical protein